MLFLSRGLTMADFIHDGKQPEDRALLMISLITGAM